MDSVAIYFHIGATRHVMLGCRGTATIEISAQKIPVIKFTMTGLFAVPSEQVTPTPVFTVDGISLVLEAYVLDMGNNVSQLLRIGREAVIIEDRACDSI